jgi:membrane protein
MIDGTIESRGTITLIGIGFLVWGALGIFSSLANGVSLAFAPAPRRSFLKHTLIGLTLMGLAGILALAALVIGVVTGILQSTASRLAVEVPGRETGIWLIGLVVPILLIFLAFLVIYRVVPNRRITWSEVVPGAIVATILWTVLRVGFTWFATNVARYDSAFGPLSTGITLIIFMYFASVIVLLGAEFARARTLDDEIELIEHADPRLLPVVIDPAPIPAPQPRLARVRWAIVAVAGLLGVLVGRLTKHDD